MKTVIIPALVSIVLLYSCEKEKPTQILTPPVVITPGNLIPNPGFEQNGQPSFSGWVYTDGPCCLDTFSTDVPSGGGSTSLNLQPMWLPAEGAAETYITGLSGNHQYQLNFNAKCINVVDPVPYASVYIKQITLASVQTLNFVNTTWTPYTLTTSLLALQPTDTLVVKLSADRTEVANWQVLFDNVELFQLP